MKRTLLIFAVVVVLLVSMLLVVGAPQGWPAQEHPPQQGEAADAALARHSPLALARLVREPQNTWSNLAFIVGGAFLVSTAATAIARNVAIALIAVGAGSFVYHASAAEVLRHLDVGAMYWLFLLTTALCAAASFPSLRVPVARHASTLLVATALVAVIATSTRNMEVLGLKPISLRFTTALAATVMILSLAQIARRLETVSAALQLLGIVTLFGIAAACQTFDRPGGRFYTPGAVVQAHAVWHVLAATTFVWAVRLLDKAAAASASKM